MTAPSYSRDRLLVKVRSSVNISVLISTLDTFHRLPTYPNEHGCSDASEIDTHLPPLPSVSPLPTDAVIYLEHLLGRPETCLSTHLNERTTPPT